MSIPTASPPGNTCLAAGMRSRPRADLQYLLPRPKPQPVQDDPSAVEARRIGLSKDVGHAALALTGKASPAAKRLICAVVEKNPDPHIKGLACLALGQYLKHQSDRVRDIQEDPEAARAWEAIFLEEGSSKESFTQFSGRDPDAMMKEAEGIFERIGKEFDGLSSQGDRLSRAPSPSLSRTPMPSWSRSATWPSASPPEITGEDIDAKPFKLSDYRGKVVYLSFWADWCGLAGPCFRSSDRSWRRCEASLSSCSASMATATKASSGS